MKEQLKQAVEKFDGLEVRSRLILTFTAVLLLYLIFDLAWFGGQSKTIRTLDSQLTKLDQDIVEYTRIQQETNAGVYSGRNNPKRQQLAELDAQLDAVQNQLESKARSLVKPEAMAELLREIIKNSEGLTLETLKKRAPFPLFEQSQENAQAQMFSHSVEMIFEGSYTETLSFLKKLEDMKSQVNFESFEYSVEQYPKSKVSLVVSTYSLSRKWIGG